MATIRGQLEDVLMEGDRLEDLECIYQDQVGEYYRRSEKPAPLLRCRGDELPTREFNDSWGGTEGEPTICFSERYIYIRQQYDGSESFCVVPRHPEQVTFIPWPGGG